MCLPKCLFYLKKIKNSVNIINCYENKINIKIKIENKFLIFNDLCDKWPEGVKKYRKKL